MSKKQKSIRVSRETEDQLDLLVFWSGATQTEIIMQAIDLLYRQKKDMSRVTDRIRALKQRI